MSLISLIRSWLQPRSAAKPTPTNHHQPRRPKPAPSPKDPQPTPPLPQATGPVDSRVRVRVYYQNASTHANLRPPVELVGTPGDPLPVTWQVLPGFVLTAIVGFTQVFPNTNQSLLCAYSPRVAGPVMIYHRDGAGDLLQVPEVLTGVVNEAFTAKALAKFADHVVGDAEQSGTFSATSQRLRFTYNLSPLEAGQRPTDAYIQLLKAKLVYQAPLAGSPLPGQLPAKTFWRVFALMRDTNTDTVWLNIGGNQWLTAADTTGRAENPFLPDPTPLTLPHSLFTNQESACRLRGTAIADATLWTTPFGEMRSQRLKEGTPVSITAVAELDNDSRWYRLSDDAYVLAFFITVDAAEHPATTVWGGVTH
ncbi:MucBP domain-containing protein [Lacticaseibacillus sp. GG6-2]